MSDGKEPWRYLPLRELGEISAGGTPSRDDAGAWGGDIPWLTPGYLTKNPAKVTSDTFERLTQLGIDRSAAVLMPSGSLLVTTRATLGARTIAGVPMATNQGFKNIRFNEALAVPEFYYYLFEMLGSELWRLATGTTFGEVSARDFGNIIVPSPRLEEQRRIAEVLDEVDGLISASMARSRKLEALKWGLVESFLREDAECGVQTTLDSILVGIDAGWSPLCEERTPVSEEWGVLKVSSVTTGRFIESESKALLPGFRPRPELRVCENDLLMCRANGVASLVGKVALVKYAPERLMLSDKTLRLVIDSGKASQDYLYFLLSSRSVRLQIDTMLSGSSGQKNIPQRFIRSINIPLPGLARQAEVVAAVSAVEADLEHERKLCTVLRDTRLGLAADLLSGRVRV